jgi:NAD(P)H dehydrogenase (quinone)
MHALIVHAHPDPNSFNAALTRAASTALYEAGHTVEISDLYAQGFTPVAGRHDFLDTLDAEHFHYQAEQLHAARSSGFAADLTREQARVHTADLLILQFPLWWGGAPAILKGWIDRVLAYGFAYIDGRRFETGLFKGKHALLGVTTGGTAERFSPGGAYGEIDIVLRPIQKLVLRYMGFQTHEPFVAYAAPRVDAASREAYLRQWQAHVVAVAQALPCPAPKEPLQPDAERDWRSRG